MTGVKSGQKIALRQKIALSWNSVALRVTLVFLASIALGTWLVTQRLYLSPPAFQYTFTFYAILGLAPALITLAACARSQPVGSRTRLALATLLSGILFILYLALIRPSFYSTIACQAETRSTLVIHQQCICGWEASSDGSAVNCSSHRLIFSPLLRITERP